MLLDCLSPQQSVDFAQHGYFCVRGNVTGRSYRIAHGTVMNIQPVNADGTFGPRLCFAPAGPLPTFDVLVAQKLALEAMEEEVLAVANQEYRAHVLA